MLHFSLSTLSHFASRLLHFALVMHFATIVITIYDSIIFCCDYLILTESVKNTNCIPKIMDRLLRLMKKHEDILSGTQGNLCTRIIEIIATLFWVV